MLNESFVKVTIRKRHIERILKRKGKDNLKWLILCRINLKRTKES